MNECLMKDFIQLYCGHSACRECLKEFIKIGCQSSIENIDSFHCFMHSCGQSICQDIIEYILGREQFVKLCDQLAQKGIIACPYCDEHYFNETKYALELFCPNCQGKICPKCKDKSHPLKGGCPSIVKKMKELNQNSKYQICPSCFYPYQKDENCNRVKCLQCGEEFCFECGCPREPTMIHGNHYHRKTCKFYGEYKFKDIWNEKCTRCKEQQNIFGQKIVCELPIEY